MKKTSYVVFGVICLFMVFYVPLADASSNTGIKSKECILIDAEEMRRRYEDQSILLNNMFLFDIRPDAGTSKVKNIPLSMGINQETIDNEALYELNVWKGKNVYLVGDDTLSTLSFCKNMLEKKFPIADIYVLKGGMKEWNGRVTGSFEDVTCETITSEKLLSIMESRRYVGGVDLRSSADYNKGHIPGAVDEGSFDRDRENLCLTSIFSNAIRKKGVVVFVAYSESEASNRCRILKWAVGYPGMYVLEGNLSDWKGPLEKGERTFSQIMNYENNKLFEHH